MLPLSLFPFAHQRRHPPTTPFEGKKSAKRDATIPIRPSPVRSSRGPTSSPSLPLLPFERKKGRQRKKDERMRKEEGKERATREAEARRVAPGSRETGGQGARKLATSDHEERERDAGKHRRRRHSRSKGCGKRKMPLDARAREDA